MDVGWWVSFNNCDLHHPLHPAWSCEVLIESDGSADILVRKAPQALHTFALRAHAGRDARAPERASSPCFIPKIFPPFRGFRVRLRRKA